MCSSQNGSPWIVLGDFNVSRSVGESTGGYSRILSAMEEFNDYLQSSELDDHRFLGFLHTWCNKRSNGCISRKLDRVHINNVGLSNLGILKRFSFPLAFRIIVPPWLNLGCKPFDSNHRIREKELITSYTTTLKAEEDLLRQKSRIQWLKAGDRNSSYFFKAITGKCNRSKIHTIIGDDGSLIEGDILVKKEAICHFQNTLGCSRPVSHGIGSTLSNIIDRVISNEQANFMGRDVIDDEIREVCFSLHPNKAPGPDGFNAHFFKITWDIVGENRNYHKDASCPRLALIVDLMKAFDMVNWGFLLETHAAFHFPSNVIMWIKACLTTPKFSISFNADLAGFFFEKRGLLQRKPMSPYLFVIAMEVLSKFLAKRIENFPSFKFHWRCDKIKLSHLCFADDLIMLCHGFLSSTRVIKAALDEFSLLSGLYANHAKSNIFTSGVSLTINQQLINLFGYTVGSLPIRYLGIPIISSRLSLHDCFSLMDRVLGRLASWLN
ncbi:hypothetical protein Dsin_008984 [Dipteronia sinensis]|uniref:Reverse transcriptase domain-containing protein n=1 Tax=Dipteronia sinensis TaxID=43782 RepID=A0AAE0AQV6_9ROSI|nr:hypothetical protein Dsin_008984 [Dipteronia sinensis]